MVCLDRVFCNFCGCYIGQVFYQPAEAPDLLHDLGAGLNFTVCPDCLHAASVAPVVPALPAPVVIALVGA